MILNCPNCAARYLLSSAAIGAEGRDVRCAKCHHQWFQPPEASDDANDQMPEDLTQDAKEQENTSEDRARQALHDDEDDIPESVKPIPEGSNVPAFAKDVVRRAPPSLQARLTGYATALTFFALVIAAGLFYRGTITNLWPPAALIYEMAGMPIILEGRDLVMESLSAQVIKNEEGVEILILKGRVINLTAQSVDVPPMRALLRSTNGDDGEGWIIDPPVDSVEPGASFAFTSDYPNVPRGVGSVNLTFVPTIAAGKHAALMP